jgi:hypothetical protein
LLAPDETVINHHYMAQLMDYGVRLGLSRKTSMTEEELRQESEVGFLFLAMDLN